MDKTKSLFAVIGLAFISACTTAAPVSVPELNFSNMRPIKVNVGRIDVVEAYKSPMSSPNIEHQMPYTPADAMQVWVKDRLKTVGNDKEKFLQVTIVDAPVTVAELPKTKGLTGLFTVDQDKRYDARLEVEMRIYSGGTLSDADTSVTVTRSITVPENASVNSRKEAYTKMIQDMMKMMNEKLEDNMSNYLGNYISY